MNAAALGNLLLTEVKLFTGSPQVYPKVAHEGDR